MDIYIVLVSFLLLLAFFDLMVGVGNDASNFLNSAMGSKVASFGTIMVFACLGVLIGATFSGGMMDIARNGLFNPEQFYFREVIWIFAGVIVSDILLLGMFNKLGLPTSTTVSIVFNLLGASVAMAIYKLNSTGIGLEHLSEYINTDKALAIISGILISVVIAFVAGVIVQWLVRVLFSFDYRKMTRYLGSLFGGIAITAILYFMIMKGFKDASFMKPEYMDFINTHNGMILLGCFFGSWLILQIFMWTIRLNVFKVVILVGTFALAFAFAGNDLVNFIGVPLAGLESYKLYTDAGSNPDLVMSALRDPVSTPVIFLLTAGIVMACTLIFSKSARKVVETSVNLSRQEGGEEQFGSTFLARTVVRGSLGVSSFFTRVVPKRWRKRIDRRFKPYKEKGAEDIAFDQVRASVNLVVASILIASATSLKLPLSTTYVTFMVAMGSSLADRAWDRETAVYRITGVFTVIAGWFITAICAGTLACIITSFLIWGNSWGDGWRLIPVAFCMVVVLGFMGRTLFANRKKAAEALDNPFINKERELLAASELNSHKVFDACNTQLIDLGRKATHCYSETVEAFLEGKRKRLKQAGDTITELTEQTKEMKLNTYKVLAKLQGDAMEESSQFYVQVIDYIREVGNSVQFMYRPAYEYIDNNHSPFSGVQAGELRELLANIQTFATLGLTMLEQMEYGDNMEELRHRKRELLSLMDGYQRKQLKRIKKKEVNTRNSVLYLNFLTETKNFVLYLASLVKTNRNFCKAVLK